MREREKQNEKASETQRERYRESKREKGKIRVNGTNETEWRKIENK